MANKARVRALLDKAFYRPPNRFEVGWGKKMPQAYKNFYASWKWRKPQPVHYEPIKEEIIRNPVTHLNEQIQDNPLPLYEVPELNEGIWGGENVIKGLIKRHRRNEPMPHYWFPVLKRSVVYSEILNKHLSVVLTQRTLRLIHEHQGFDHYILKTEPCDLQSELAIKLKRKMLLALRSRCSHLNEDSKRRDEILAEYAHYVESFTDEDLDWYGLTWQEAVYKISNQYWNEHRPQPHKVEFRTKLIEQLRAAGIVEGGGQQQLEPASSRPSDADIEALTQSETTASDGGKGSAGWLKRLNPFAPKDA